MKVVFEISGLPDSTESTVTLTVPLEFARVARPARPASDTGTDCAPLYVRTGLLRLRLLPVHQSRYRRSGLEQPGTRLRGPDVWRVHRCLVQLPRLDHGPEQPAAVEALASTH